MGGLVARSYIQGNAYPDADANGPQGPVRRVIFAASPHKGFPFDYQTWEGLTWRDYLYNAPWYSGGLFGTLSSLMDSSIWPTLIGKRYKQYRTIEEIDRELAQGCRLLEADNFRSAFVLETDSQGNAYSCSKRFIAKWAHTSGRS